MSVIANAGLGETSFLGSLASSASSYYTSSIYDQLYTAYRAAYPTVAYNYNPAIIITPQSGSELLANLYSTAGTLVTSAAPGSFLLSDLTNVASFTALANGTWIADFTMTETANSNSYPLSGTISVTITTPTQDIFVPIDTASGYYSFAAASADSYGRTGADIITAALGSGYSYIVFDARATSATAGTLFTTDSYTNYLQGQIGAGTQQTVYANAINSLYFIPSGNSGTFSVPYTAYSGNGIVVKTGNLTVSVGTGSLNVSLTLDTASPYTFSSQPRSGASSAYTLLTNAISGYGVGSWSFIRFDTTNASGSGALYNSASFQRAITSSDAISASDLYSLYFVPSQIGTFSVPYSVYSTMSSSYPVATGTLSISVSNIPAGNMDVSYTTTLGGTISLKESDFAEFFQSKRGSSYALSYVTFNQSSGNGTFRYDGTTFIPYSSANYYAGTYTGTTPSNARYLERVSFTAPASSTGFTAVAFTCYGSAVSGLVSAQESGVLYIFYSAADVPAITYSAYDASYVTLRESDFASVYRTAMNVTTANPSFHVRFLSAPSYGLFYQNYSVSRNTGTRLTGTDISAYAYYIGGRSTLNSVSTLTYVPWVISAAATDPIRYIAYDANETPLYTGIVRFKLSPDRTVSASSDGLDFKLGDFYSVADADPVLYVTFAKPESGKIYVSSNNRIIPVTESMKLYTTNASDGVYPAGMTHYVPKADSTASVTLTYTAHTKSGASYDTSIVVTPTVKTASASFTDVPSDVGVWAAGAIDFASKYGLVNGTAAGKFSPNSTMKRCDLVLIFYRMAGEPTVSGTVPYTDVPSSAYYYSSAVWAARNGIMDGVVSDSKYDPSGAITRQDYTRILYNYTKAMGGSVTSSGSIAGYADAGEVSSYARDAMIWAVANGYINGISSNQLGATHVATRAQIVTLLHRYLTY